MNKKTIIATVVAAGMSFAAQADLLHFMVTAFDWTGPKYFDFAMVGVALGGDVNWNGGEKTYLLIQPTTDSGATASYFLKSDAARYTAGDAWADLTGYTDPEDGYTFYIETYTNGAEEPTWTYNEETAKSYATLLKEKHIYKYGTDPQSVTAWVVPEPTSGLMALLGFAFLALRRKRV